MKPDTAVFLVGFIVVLMMLIMVGDYFYFRHVGRRFTADHGQTLCLRVQALEMNPKPCEYD